MKTRDLFLTVLLCELAFLAACAPYLLGIYSYAPKDHLSQSFMGQTYPEELEKLTLRDSAGQGDFPIQERHFLRFYRDQLKKGELPFWNKRSYGGISQEDSLIYSYLSPINLVWLLTDKDHLAKGIQMLILMNLSMIGILLWCVLLELPVHWAGLCVGFITLTPMALHFQGHSHQPALYAMGMITSACFVQFMRQGGVVLLAGLFLSFCLSIAFNFISLLLILGIFLVLFGLPYLVQALFDAQSRLRLVVSVLVVIFAFVCMSFFLGPILLEAHLVRGPVTPPRTVWGPLFNPIHAIWYMWISNKTPIISYWFLIPLGCLLMGLKRKWDFFSKPVVGLLLVWLISSTLASSLGAQDVFRTVIPGMKYTGNIFLRQAFMGNQFAILLLALLLHRLSQERLQWSELRLIDLGLIGVIGVNVAFLSMAIWPDMWDLLSNTFNINTLRVWSGKVSLYPERLYNVIFGLITSLAVYFFWRANISPLSRRMLYSAMFVLLTMFVGMYQFDTPNLPINLDDTKNPLLVRLEGEPGTKTISLKRCSDDFRPGAGESAYFGMSPIDGPADSGLFSVHRQFWTPLNNQEEMFGDGKFYYDLAWICEESVVSEDGTLSPTFLSLLRMLGVKILFSVSSLDSDGISFLDQVGDVRAYAIQGAWEDIVLLPGLTADELLEMVDGLRKGNATALATFDTMDAKKVVVPYVKETELLWSVGEGNALTERGLLFMNHPVEFNRQLHFPLTNLPVEAKWELCSDAGCEDFPLTRFPYRFLPYSGRQDIIIRYSLNHYKGWGVISCVGAIAGLCVLLFYGWRCRRPGC